MCTGRAMEERHRNTFVRAAPGTAPTCDGLSAKAIRGNDGSSGKRLGGPCCSSTNRRRALSDERVRGSLGGTLDVATAVLRRCEGARGAVAPSTETPRPRHHARCSIRTGPLPPPHATHPVCWPGETKPGRQRMTCVPRLGVLIHAPCPYLSIISDIANVGTRSLLTAERRLQQRATWRGQGERVYGQVIAFSRLRRARRCVLVRRAVD